MGLSLFGSESKSDATSSASETGQQVDGGIASSTSTGTITTGKHSNVNVVVSDLGAIASAFDFANAGIDEVINASEAARLDALEFAAGTLTQTSSAFSDAAKLAQQSNSDAFLFSAGAFNRSSDIIEAGLVSVDKAVGEANKINLEATNNALQFGAGALTSVLNSVSNSTANTLSSLANAQSDTIATISEATKSESAQSFDKLVKVAGVAFVVLGLVVAFTRYK